MEKVPYSDEVPEWFKLTDEQIESVLCKNGEFERVDNNKIEDCEV